MQTYASALYQLVLTMSLIFSLFSQIANIFFSSLVRITFRKFDNICKYIKIPSKRPMMSLSQLVQPTPAFFIPFLHFAQYLSNFAFPSGFLTSHTNASKSFFSHFLDFSFVIFTNTSSGTPAK